MLTTLKNRQAPCPGVDSKHKTDYIIFCCFVCVFLSCWGFILIFVFCLFVFWGGDVIRRKWDEFQEGKNMTKTYCIKNVKKNDIDVICVLLCVYNF